MLQPSIKDFNFLRLNGASALEYAEVIADLRIKIFKDYPYLYLGDHNYEMNYLKTYFDSSKSFILLVKHGEKVIGVTTAIWAEDENLEFKSPFQNNGYDPKQICYFGESLLLPEYRGLGIGKKFFSEREIFAKSLGSIKYLSFCAVIREEDHPLKPEGYKKLDSFWNDQGFLKVNGLVTHYSWKDIDQDKETYKTMQFWMKQLA